MAYCEYQLKLKEQEIVDRIKEITSRFQVELEESRLKLETALQQKAEEVRMRNSISAILKQFFPFEA